MAMKPRIMPDDAALEVQPVGNGQVAPVPLDFLNADPLGVGAPTEIRGDQSFTVNETFPGMGEFEIGDDGDIREVHPEDDFMPTVRTPAFAENLAEQLDDRVLSSMATELIDAVEHDISSREPWTSRFKKGMEMMGLIDDETDDGAFPGASTAVMPIISEATVQFWARSLGEQVPSEGPFKGTVLGEPNTQSLDRAERVAEYMNHEAMLLDKGWYQEHSRMLFALPWQGTCLKKVYRDRVLGRNVSVFVSSEDFVINHAFGDLESAPRFCHRIWRTHNEVRKEQVAGIYRDIPLTKSSQEELPEESDIKLQVQDVEQNDQLEDTRHELYEVYCEWDLPGFEDVDPETGEPTGIALPYIVTIDRESQVVLSVYRGWKEADPLKRRRVNFVPFNFVPGVGFYALGFFHLIGGLQAAATGALRLIIDGAATASIQGGFVSEDAAMRDQSLEIEPGIWKKVNVPSEGLQKAFYTPPFREPSPVLEKVLQVLVERSEKFAATTEMMTGDTNAKNAPVGSTVALIEQGQKVFSTIHRGLHMSLAAEARIRYELIQEYLPQEGYPYDVEGEHANVMVEDFAPGIDVVPVSDPNIFSAVQRNAQADAVYQLATANPDLMRRDVAIKRVLEGMKVPNAEELMIEIEAPPPRDPISEIQAILRGEPVQAYPDQLHVAHLQHIASFIENPEFGGNPMIAEIVQANLVALVGQHLAYAWATHAKGLGAPAQLAPPPIQPEAEQGVPGMEQVQGSGQMGPMDPGMDPAMMGGDPMMAPMGPGGDPGMMQPPPEAGLGVGQGPMPGQDPMGILQQDQGVPPMGPGGPGGQMPEPTPTNAPPEIVAQMAAQIAPQMAQVPGLPAVGQQGQGDDTQAKLALEEGKRQLKAQESQQKLAMQQEEHQMKMQHEQQMAEIKIQLEEMKTQAKMQQEQMKAEIAQMQAQQQAALDQRKMEQEAQLGEQEMFQRQQESEQQAQLNQQQMAQHAAESEQQMQLNDQEAHNDMAINAQQSALQAENQTMSQAGSSGSSGGQQTKKKAARRSRKK